METVQDFSGNNVSDAISNACREYGVSQEELTIEILETGSAGIFGLCRKKAKIRAGLKPSIQERVVEEQVVSVPPSVDGMEKCQSCDEEQTVEIKIPQHLASQEQGMDTENKGRDEGKKVPPSRERQFVQPSVEVINSIRVDLEEMLRLMGFPGEVKIQVTDNMVDCVIAGEHEDEIVGDEGRILDSLQYLLRKMVNQRLPDRMPLSLDAGNFREKRIKHLRELALTFAEQVRESGKTRAIAALNPSERRIVHMVLQDDKTIRSRSVGEGLFKKVLIYKPGKSRSNKPSSRRRNSRGRQGGNSSDR